LVGMTQLERVAQVIGLARHPILDEIWAQIETIRDP
jgi:hypothetical protein